VRTAVFQFAFRIGCASICGTVSFEVAAGESFGCLGSNGAGKSTTARTLTGFITPTSGRARVAGIAMAKHPSDARRYMGRL
jgi:ABC-2 type transport system ATP-binding protein